MSWVADGQDGNGMHLEKKNGLFFQVYRFYLGKLTKTLIVVYFLLEKSLDIFILANVL